MAIRFFPHSAPLFQFNGVRRTREEMLEYLDAEFGQDGGVIADVLNVTSSHDHQDVFVILHLERPDSEVDGLPFHNPIYSGNGPRR
jgi:hypothetical protein